MDQKEKNKQQKKYISASELVKNLMENLSTGESSANVWLEIVGEKLAGYCELYDIKNGVAIIEVEHPAVAQTIMSCKNEIIEKFHEKYESLNITKIRTKVKKFYANQNTKERTPIEKSSKQIEINPSLPQNIKAIFEKINANRSK